MLFLVASISLLLNYDSAVSANASSGELDAARVDYVAQAGSQHALWRAQNNACMGDVTIPDTSLGADSYNATITGAAPGTALSFTADKDAWIRSDAVSMNNGKTTWNHVRREAAGTELVLTRFDVSSIAAKAQISSAIAWFHIKAGKMHPEGPITIHEITADWTETTVTWESFAGAYGSSPIGMISAQDTGDVWVGINLTAQVQAWINGQPNYGILFNPQADGTHTEYTSREDGTNPPRLEVVVGSGPASPVTIKATGKLDNGVARKLKDKLAAAYQAPGTVTLQLGADSGADALIDSFYERNYGGADYLQINDESNWQQYPLLRFNLATLPYGAKVLTATLQLNNSATNTAGTATVHRLTQRFVEGTRTGGGVADGATWSTHDGSAAWTSPGGDFDPAPVATANIDASSGWVSWDVTSLANAWLNGTANNGLLIRSTDGLRQAKFASRETSDYTLRPKLTITYACECGNACLAPRGSGNILMIVAESNLSDPQDAYKKALFEAWGYSVEVINDGAGANSYETKLADRDVVYISETVDPTSLGTKVSDVPIGVVNEDGWMNDELGFELGNSSSWPVGRSITVTDTDHYITAPFAAGALEIYNADMGGLTIGGTPAPDARSLADWGGGLTITLLDAGAKSATGGTAAGRRVMLPFGRDTQIDWTEVNNSGQLIMQRSLDWAMGAGKASNGKKVLLVVGDTANLTIEQADKKALMEGWGHTISLIATADTQAAFDTAAGAVDVVYIPELGTTPMNELGNKADNLAVGVITEEARRALLLGGFALFPFVDTDSINLTDNSHYITETLAIGNVQLSTAIQSMWVLQGTLAVDLHVLGELSGTDPGLAYLESGELRNDSTPAPARRVKLPWGSYNFDVNLLTDDGLTIMQRAIEWGAGSTDTGPIAHWKLDETSGTTALDSVGGHNGTLQNGPAWSTGYLDGALDIDGVDDVIVVPHDESLSLTDAFTLTAWINKSSVDYYDQIFNKGQVGYDSNYFFGTVDGDLAFGWYDGAWIEFKTTGLGLQSGTWYHIAGVFDNSGDAVRLYLDGTEVLSDTTGLTPPTNTGNLRLGNPQWVSDYHGKFDDLRIYDVALSAVEIATLAAETTTTGPIAHWKLDDGTGLTAIDSEGGHDGTLANGPVWVAGQLGDALSFPGNDDYVNVPHDDALSLTDMTISLWLKTSALNNVYQTMVRKKQQANYQLTTWSDEIVFAFNDGSGMKLFQTTNANLTTNQWYHVAATLDDTTGDINIYVDGTSIYNTTTPYHPLPNTEPLTIGGTPDAGTYWPGMLDDIRLYDYPMSATEVSDLFTAGGGSGGGGGGGCNGPFTDSFDAVNYGGGSTNWKTDWQETGEATSASGGDIQIANDISNYQLQVRDDGQTVWREADLSGATSATLSFDYRRQNLSGSNDYVAVEVSYDGGDNWSELDRFIGTATDGSYTGASYPLNAGSLSSSTRIRFRTPNSGMSNSNKVWFDNVEITCAP